MRKEKKDQALSPEETTEELREEIKNAPKKAALLKTLRRSGRNIIAYLIIWALITAAVIIVVLDYPKISTYIKNKVNPYGFDYNFKKISEYDWDAILTEKKIASIWKTSRKNINSAKNPDWSWILEDPKQLVEEAKCAALLDEKILDQENQDKKNLLNVNVLLCKNTDETKNTYSSRKNEIKNVSQNDNTITIKNLDDTKNLGEEGYTYLIEKKAAKEGDSADKFAGIVFRQGPFMVMVDESEQQGTSYLSAEKMKTKIAKYLDKELKKILTWY